MNALRIHFCLFICLGFAACASQADIDAWHKQLYGAEPPRQTGAQDSPHAPAASGPARPAHPATRDLDEALALPGERFDLALALLLFAKTYGGGHTDVDAWLGTLDRWGMTLTKRVRDMRSSQRRLDELRRYIHEDLDFRFDETDPRGYRTENLLFDRVLERKRGYCVTLSLLYLILAQSAGVDLQAVRLPGHFAVMHTADDRPGIIETTSHGQFRPRDELYATYRMSVQSVEEHGVFLSPLPVREIFSTLYNNLGGLGVLRGDDAAGLKHLGRAIELGRCNVEAYYNRAGILLRRGGRDDLQSAMADLNEAIRLDPNFVHARSRRAGLLHLGGEREKGMLELAQARRLRPELAVTWVEEGVMLASTGDGPGARAAFEQALERDTNNLDALRNLAIIEEGLGNAARAKELRDLAARVLDGR